MSKTKRNTETEYLYLYLVSSKKPDISGICICVENEKEYRDRVFVFVFGVVIDSLSASPDDYAGHPGCDGVATAIGVDYGPCAKSAIRIHLWLPMAMARYPPDTPPSVTSDPGPWRPI